MKTEAASPTPVRSGQLWPLSIEAYHVLGEAGLIPKNSELLYGLVYKKMPKSPSHTTLVLRLLQAFQALNPPGVHIRVEQPVICRESEPEPDISVVSGTIQDYARAHPTTAELVVEVCVTSHEYDRSKLRAYAAANVKECWLVLGPEKRIEVHRTPAGELFLEKTEFGPGGTAASQSVPALRLSLEKFFLE